MFFRCFFCTVRLSIFERFVFASFEPLRFCKKVRFVFPDLYTIGGQAHVKFYYPSFTPFLPVPKVRIKKVLIFVEHKNRGEATRHHKFICRLHNLFRQIH